MDSIIGADIQTVEELKNIFPTKTFSELVDISYKINKMRHNASKFYYRRSHFIQTCSLKKILNSTEFKETDGEGRYLKIRYENPGRPPSNVPMKDLKHKIYNIRKLAKEGYYGVKTSERIANMSSEEIYNMKLYKSLNTRGKKIKNK